MLHGPMSNSPICLYSKYDEQDLVFSVKLQFGTLVFVQNKFLFKIYFRSKTFFFLFQKCLDLKTYISFKKYFWFAKFWVKKIKRFWAQNIFGSIEIWVHSNFKSKNFFFSDQNCSSDQNYFSDVKKMFWPRKFGA